MKKKLYIQQTTNDYKWLGTVTRISEFYDYAIVEYIPKNETGKRYSPHVKGRSTSHSFTNLDEAIAFAIAYKKEGPNTRAHQYFIQGMRKN
jgi:hypothetical protein